MKAYTSEKYCSISFDVWGTLIDLDYMLGRIAQVVAEKEGKDENLYRVKVLDAYERSKVLRRKNPGITPVELLDKSREIMSEMLEIDVATLNDVIEEAFSKTRVNDAVYQDVIPTLDVLSHLGLKIGILGNVLFWPSRLTVSLLDRTGLSKYFSTYVFSDQVGFSKPDREAFLKYAEIVGCEPERIIHIGDNVVEDVGGALSSGFNAVLIRRDFKDSIMVKPLRSAIIRDMRELLEVIKQF